MRVLAFCRRAALTAASILILLHLPGVVPTAEAQEPDVEIGPVAPGTWAAYPAMRRVQAVISTEQHLWAGTDGGVFSYHLASGEIRRFTRVDGLSGVDVRSVAHDEDRGHVWVGYENGALDRIATDDGEVTSFLDIARADRYPQRGINRIRPLGDSLLVATDFGVVVFDLELNEVRDTFDKFGDWDRGRPAYDIIAAPLDGGAPGFWVATEGGVAHARQDVPNLRVPSAWTASAGAPAPARSLIHFRNRVHAGGEHSGDDDIGDLWQRSGGSWSRMFVSDRTVFNVVPHGDGAIAFASFNVAHIDAAGERVPANVSGVFTIGDGAVTNDGTIWVGSLVHGLGRLHPLTNVPWQSVTVEEYIVPNGPLTNSTTAVEVAPNGEVWLGYAPSFSLINGVGRLRGSSWTNFTTLHDDDVVTSPVRDIHIDRRGMAWAGSEGDGLTRVDVDGNVTTFRANNSTLRPDLNTNTYIVVMGVDEDDDGRIWVTNRNAPDPLSVWDPEDGWASVPRPAATPSVAPRFTYLHIDQFGNKWIRLLNAASATGGGFMVLRTPDIHDPSTHDAVTVIGGGSAATGTGLPDQNVRAFAHDLDGRMWIGTARGLAVVFSPGSVLANPALAQPAWARTPDQASYFLRDLAIYSIAVDPAGRKWIASAGGAWLINDAGNEVVAHLTAENSPLPSSTVLDVSINQDTGTVYFATDRGLVSYRGDSVAPSTSVERLHVYPNPFRPQYEPLVHIEGLVAETRVRILTPDGQVVASMDVRGGSISWDGRDERTGRPVPSGVYLVAAAGTGGEGTAYGKIALIR